MGTLCPSTFKQENIQILSCKGGKIKLFNHRLKKSWLLEETKAKDYEHHIKGKKSLLEGVSCSNAILQLPILLLIFAGDPHSEGILHIRK